MFVKGIIIIKNINFVYYLNMENKKFIKCPACKEKSFVIIKKDFVGFKAIAEKKACAMCGYEFKEDEDIDYIQEKSLFNDDGEEKKFCRNCEHYVVHPLTQVCDLIKKEVTALDSCDRFEKKKD
jgi:hypothetical protein